MIESTSVASAGPFGPAAHIAVERGLAEFRSGRPVVINSRSGSVAALPIDGMTDGTLGGIPAALRAGAVACRHHGKPGASARPRRRQVRSVLRCPTTPTRPHSCRWSPMSRVRRAHRWPERRRQCRGGHRTGQACAAAAGAAGGGCDGERGQHRRAHARRRRRGHGIPAHGDRFAGGRRRGRRPAQRRRCRRAS